MKTENPDARETAALILKILSTAAVLYETSCSKIRLNPISVQKKGVTVILIKHVYYLPSYS